jgi:hypothetical protein
MGFADSNAQAAAFAVSGINCDFHRSAFYGCRTVIWFSFQCCTLAVLQCRLQRKRCCAFLPKYFAFLHGILPYFLIQNQKLEHFKIENALKGMDCRAASPLAMTIPCAMTTPRHS